MNIKKRECRWPNVFIKNEMIAASSAFLFMFIHYFFFYSFCIGPGCGHEVSFPFRNRETVTSGPIKQKEKEKEAAVGTDDRIIFLISFYLPVVSKTNSWFPHNISFISLSGPADDQRECK
jgi:hypothetical protein